MLPSMVQDGVYFIGGTKQADGQTTSDTDTTTIEAEYSKPVAFKRCALCIHAGARSLVQQEEGFKQLSSFC